LSRCCLYLWYSSFHPTGQLQKLQLSLIQSIMFSTWYTTAVVVVFYFFWPIHHESTAAGVIPQRLWTNSCQELSWLVRSDSATLSDGAQDST
jgi:hypothetical protein